MRLNSSAHVCGVSAAVGDYRPTEGLGDVGSILPAERVDRELKTFLLVCGTRKGLGKPHFSQAIVRGPAVPSPPPGVDLVPVTTGSLQRDARLLGCRLTSYPEGTPEGYFKVPG